MLIDLIVNHSDDWFTFRVPARAGESSPSTTSPSSTRSATRGRCRRRRLEPVHHHRPRPPLAGPVGHRRTPLVGPVLDEVVIGIDEDANLVWAVEQIVAGRNLETPPDELPQPAAQPTIPRFSYLPMTPVPRYWHPYLLAACPTTERRFVQGRAYVLSGPHPDRFQHRPATCSKTTTPRPANPCTT